MTDRDRPHQLQVRPQHPYEAGKPVQRQGPSATKILAVMGMLPVGGTLLALSGITLIGTIIGLALTTPLFILFSPVLVPAAIVISLAVMAFLASGAFGLTALTSFSWVLNYLRQVTGRMPDQLDYAKRRMQDMAGYTGQKTKEAGQTMQQKVQEGGRRE